MRDGLQAWLSASCGCARRSVPVARSIAASRRLQVTLPECTKPVLTWTLVWMARDE